MIRIEIEHFPNPDHQRCIHDACDGREAKWSFPQTATLANGPWVSCGVHLARFAERALVEVFDQAPIPHGKRRNHR